MRPLDIRPGDTVQIAASLMGLFDLDKAQFAGRRGTVLHVEIADRHLALYDMATIELMPTGPSVKIGLQNLSRIKT